QAIILFFQHDVLISQRFTQVHRPLFSPFSCAPFFHPLQRNNLRNTIITKPSKPIPARRFPKPYIKIKKK
ncbi:hypothetical protein, partial [Enterobacter intestinihominis]